MKTMVRKHNPCRVILEILILATLIIGPGNAVAQYMVEDANRRHWKESEYDKYWRSYWDKYWTDLWIAKYGNYDPLKNGNDQAKLARIVGLQSVNNETGSPGINPMNGALFLQETDLAVPGRGPTAAFTRTYKNKIWRNGKVKNGGGTIDLLVLNPISLMGMGWQFHMGRVWKDGDEHDNNYWIYESPDGVKYQLRTNRDTLWLGNRYRAICRSFDGSGIRLREVGSWSLNPAPPYNHIVAPDTLFLYTSDGTCYTMSVANKHPENVWNNCSAVDMWYPEKIQDSQGNYLSLEYGYFEGDLIFTYLTKITDACNREFLFHSHNITLPSPDGHTTRILDSLRTTDANGQLATYKYQYENRQVAQIPFGKPGYYDVQRVGSVGINFLYYPLLRRVIYPNGDTTTYDYNSSLELKQVQTPQKGKIAYVYGEYRYTYGYYDLPADSTFFVRAITAESLWAKTNQTQAYVTTYGRHTTDGSGFPLTNPDSVGVIDAVGNLAAYRYAYAQKNNIIKTVPYGLPSSQSQFQGNGGQKVLLQKKVNEYIWDVKPYYTYSYENLRLASETLLVNGTSPKQYVTRYRNYDAFMTARRIDFLGDIATESDDRSLFRDYLHGSATAKPVEATGFYSGMNKVKFKATWNTGDDEGSISKVYLRVERTTNGGSTWYWVSPNPYDSVINNPPNYAGQNTFSYEWDVPDLQTKVRATMDFLTSRNGTMVATTPAFTCNYCPPPPGERGPGGGESAGDTLPRFTWGLNAYADQNLLGLVTREKVTSDTTGNNVLSDLQYGYDDPARIIQSSYSPAPGRYEARYDGIKRRGLMTQVTLLSNDEGGGSIFYNSYMNYDQVGNVIKAIDANGHETRQFYNDTYRYAYPWKTEVPVSSGPGTMVTFKDYDLNTGLVTVEKDPNGNETHYAYDNVNRLRKAAQPGDWSGAWVGWGSAVPSLVCMYSNVYPYSTIDSVKMNATPQYTFTRTFKDGFGRVIQVLKTSTPTSDSSIVENFSYDGVGNKDKVSYPYRLTKRTFYTEPNWAKPYWAYSYDALGRVTKKKHSTLPDSAITSYNGAWSTLTDANGHVTPRHQNASGQVDTINAPLSANVYTTYDRLGQVTQVQDAEGKQTKYRYDYSGRLRAVKSPDATSTYSYGDLSNVSVLNTYDSVGNLRFRKNGKGVTEYRYDELNRLTGTWNNSTQKAEYVYDVIPTDPVEGIPTGLNNPLCKLNRIKDLNPTVETVKLYYDTRGRLGQRSIYLETLGQKKVQYNYNQADILTSLTYPDNTTVTYTFNLFGQVTGIPGYLSNVKYNASSQPTSLPYADNSTTTVSYDGRQRPLNLVTNYSILSLTYAYNHSLISSITDNNNSQRTQSFQHDALDRITQMSGNTHTEAYTYHLDGNLWTYSRDGNARTYNYVTGTDKLSSTTGFGAYSYNHDDAGNVTNKGNNSYGYDYNNLLVSVYLTMQDRMITNSYNAGGQRVKKVDDQLGTFYYIYEGLSIIAELDASGGLTAKHVYGLGQHIARVDGSGTHFYHNDAVGSVRAITKPGGSQRGPIQPVLEKEYGYYPFGDSLYETGTLANVYKFGGKEEVAGLSDAYDFSARYYDAEIGRFYGIDPLASGVISPYAYCANNPLGLVDPTGMGEREMFIDPSESGGKGNSSWNSTGSYFDFLFQSLYLGGIAEVMGRMSNFLNNAFQGGCRKSALDLMKGIADNGNNKLTDFEFFACQSEFYSHTSVIGHVLDSSIWFLIDTDLSSGALAHGASGPYFSILPAWPTTPGRYWDDYPCLRWNTPIGPYRTLQQHSLNDEDKQRGYNVYYNGRDCFFGPYRW